MSLIANIKPNKLEEFLKCNSLNRAVYHSLGDKFEIVFYKTNSVLYFSPKLLPEYCFTRDDIEKFFNIIPDNKAKDFEFKVVYTGSKELMSSYLARLFDGKELDFEFTVELKTLKYGSTGELAWYFKDHRIDFCLSHEGFIKDFSLTLDSVVTYLNHVQEKQETANKKLEENRMNPKNIASQRYTGPTVQNLPMELVVEKKVIIRDIEVTKANIQEIFAQISKMLED